MNDKFPLLRDQAIAVLDRHSGVGDAIAVVDLKIGGLIIRRVCVRSGPDGQRYIDMPETREDDNWVSLIEITSAPLAERVREVVLSSIGEPA